MAEAGGIMRAVSEPPKVFGAAPELFAASGGLATLAFFATFNGLTLAVVFAAAHAVVVLLTIRDPDLPRVLMAWFRTGRASSFRQCRGNSYVP